MLYTLVYLAFVLAILIAAWLYIWFVVVEETNDTRGFLPIAILIALIANVLIALWIIIYIGFIYKPAKV